MFNLIIALIGLFVIFILINNFFHLEYMDNNNKNVNEKNVNNNENIKFDDNNCEQCVICPDKKEYVKKEKYDKMVNRGENLLNKLSDNYNEKKATLTGMESKMTTMNQNIEDLYNDNENNTKELLNLELQSKKYMDLKNKCK